jgi:ferredoxin
MLEAGIMQRLPQFSNPSCNQQCSSLPTPLLRKQPHPLKSRHLVKTQAAINSDEAETIQVHFKSANVTVTARPGDNIYYDLAEKNGIDTITVGCCSGNCGVCEVEVRKYNAGESVDDAAAIVVRSCITPLPPGYSRIEINELIDDVWGLDGYDT